MSIKTEFVVIMCGSRTWRNSRAIERELERLLTRYSTRLFIRHGDEPNGADKFIYEACEAYGVRHREYCAALPRHEAHEGFQVAPISDWKRHGKAAGPIRNRAMADDGADGLVAFRNEGNSRGTDGMCELAEERGIPVIVRR